ncbi:MAG: UbiA family prenyltransferase [Candidatus Rifleibacteriota bacterium]
MGFLSRWLQFLKERHEPIGITVMIFAFFSANILMANPHDPITCAGIARLLPGFLLVWLVFLHMRLFDEVKDYDFDRQHNPDRPLARGLISLGEFTAMTLLCILTESGLSLVLGWQTFVTYVMVLCFTLMMRMEFFIGDWMRPKLELYAITHTFSASMIGLLIHSVSRSADPSGASQAFLLFALGNWFVFNVFEFGRKTFGKEEERDGVDSYSARLNPWGAVVLLMINVIIAWVCFYYAAIMKFAAAATWSMMAPSLVVSLMVAVAGAVYASRNDKKGAKIYRGTVTLYLLAYPASIAAAIYLQFYR